MCRHAHPVGEGLVLSVRVQGRAGPCSSERPPCRPVKHVAAGAVGPVGAVGAAGAAGLALGGEAGGSAHLFAHVPTPEGGGAEPNSRGPGRGRKRGAACLPLSTRRAPGRGLLGYTVGPIRLKCLHENRNTQDGHMAHTCNLQEAARVGRVPLPDKRGRLCLSDQRVLFPCGSHGVAGLLPCCRGCAVHVTFQGTLWLWVFSPFPPGLK